MQIDREDIADALQDLADARAAVMASTKVSIGQAPAALWEAQSRLHRAERAVAELIRTLSAAGYRATRDHGEWE